MPFLANSVLKAPQFTPLVMYLKVQPLVEALINHKPFFDQGEDRKRPELAHTQTKGSSRENMVSFSLHHMARKHAFRTPFLVAKLTRAVP